MAWLGGLLTCAAMLVLLFRIGLLGPAVVAVPVALLLCAFARAIAVAVRVAPGAVIVWTPVGPRHVEPTFIREAIVWTDAADYRRLRANAGAGVPRWRRLGPHVPVEGTTFILPGGGPAGYFIINELAVRDGRAAARALCAQAEQPFGDEHVLPTLASMRRWRYLLLVGWVVGLGLVGFSALVVWGAKGASASFAAPGARIEEEVVLCDALLAVEGPQRGSRRTTWDTGPEASGHTTPLAFGPSKRLGRRHDDDVMEDIARGSGCHGPTAKRSPPKPLDGEQQRRPARTGLTPWEATGAGYLGSMNSRIAVRSLPSMSTSTNAG